MNTLAQKVQSLLLSIVCKTCGNFLVEKEMFIKTEEVMLKGSQGAVFAAVLKPCSCGEKGASQQWR